MGENGGLTLLVGVVVVAIVLQCAGAQEVHVVGGNTGWIVPQSGGAQAYVDWASAETFNVGNILTFNFATGSHDVVEVPKASFDACMSTNNISAIIRTGPANFTLNGIGEHYYICTVGQHCQSGQKLAINVSASTSAPTPNTSPPPPATTTTPPPPASSSSAVFASFSVTLLPIAMGFFL